MSKRILFTWIILFAIVFGLAFAWKEYNRTQASTENFDAIIPESAEYVIEEFIKNEQAAGAKYNNKAIIFKGTVKSIELNDSVQTVIIGNNLQESGVICEFEQKESIDLKKLKVGDSVRVKGICTGFLMDIILVRCILVK